MLIPKICEHVTLYGKRDSANILVQRVLKQNKGFSILMLALSNNLMSKIRPDNKTGAIIISVFYVVQIFFTDFVSVIQFPVFVFSLMSSPKISCRDRQIFPNSIRNLDHSDHNMDIQINQNYLWLKKIT